MLLRKISAFVLIILMSSCRQNPENGSTTKIDSGSYINPTSTNRVAGVGNIFVSQPGVLNGAACTATAVSDNTLITAAHCVASLPRTSDGSFGGQVCFTNYLISNQCSNDIHIPSEFVGQDDGTDQMMRHDVAIIIFPSGTFKNYVTMSIQSPRAGDKIYMIGYSVQNQDQSQGIHQSSKRWGENKIQEFLSTGTIATIYGGTAQSVAVSPGDSGGPMFTNDCKLIGVASRMSEGQSKASLHTNLTIDVNRAFYQQLTSNTKAYLCGMTGMDSGHCSADGVTQYNAALPATEMPCDTKPAVSNPTTMTSEIFVAAEDGSTANSVRLKASVTANVSKVSLCETPTTNKNEMSTLAKCNTTSLSLASEKISDTSRVVYATGANFSPTAKLYTMVAFDSTNNVVGFRHISVEQK